MQGNAEALTLSAVREETFFELGTSTPTVCDMN